MDYTFIQNAFKEIELKIFDHQTVSDGFYDYNIFDFEFVTDVEENIFLNTKSKIILQDSIKIKIGSNVKNAFEKYFENCLNQNYTRDIPPVFTKEQQKLIEKMKGLA